MLRAEEPFVPTDRESLLQPFEASRARAVDEFRHLREQLGAYRGRLQQRDRLRSFAMGLVYDALGWTTITGAFSAPAMQALRSALDIACGVEAVKETDILRVRRVLREGGWHVMPPLGR